MRLAAFLSLTAASVALAIVQKDYSWLIAPVSVFLFLGLSPFGSPKAPKAVRRPSGGGAAAGTAVGATGAVAAASWWADGHTHGGDTADASGGDGGGDGGGGDGGGCGGCGGCGCGG
ncbi:hypothetical protein [Streptomyces sp. NPDC058155]|uniref:hypothetical protein n=1 Tax=Streptomyces sp. NPDC058155 TaxID=3346359 RepID=UPI0036DFF89E